MKLGGMFKKLKAIFNYSASAQGSATGPFGSWEGKLRNAVARHTGVLAYDTGHVDFNIDRAIPTWESIGTEALVQMFDGKTRHFGNISRKKILDIVEEIVPIVIAHDSASGSMDYATQFARKYHKLTQGYDMHAGIYGDWDVGRMNPYLTVKAIRFLGNASGIIPAVNKRLPKGFNL